jgi:hypothetical protein
MKEKDIREFFNRAYVHLLREQDEDDPFATDDEGGDEGGDEEPADEEAGGDEPAEGEEGEEGEGEEEEPEVEVEEEDEVRFGKSLDDQLQAIFIDIESDSLKSAAIQEEGYSLSRTLLREQEDDPDAPPIDIDKFASETARLIKNFDAFFDIEELLQAKARSFLLDKYGEETADEFTDLLKVRHGIETNEEEREREEDLTTEIPIAVGASGGGAGGGGAV